MVRANDALFDGRDVAMVVADAALVALAGVKQDAQTGELVQEAHELSPWAEVATPRASDKCPRHKDDQSGQRRGRIVARGKSEMHGRGHHHVRNCGRENGGQAEPAQAPCRNVVDNAGQDQTTQQKQHRCPVQAGILDEELLLCAKPNEQRN